MADHIGKTFVFDYGDFAVKVEYLSETTLRWEQLKGPSVGLKGEESYRFVAVRPRLYFIWWQEKDTSMVAQVVDFEGKRVHTTWTPAAKKVEHFQGRVRDWKA